MLRILFPGVSFMIPATTPLTDPTAMTVNATFRAQLLPAGTAEYSMHLAPAPSPVEPGERSIQTPVVQQTSSAVAPGLVAMIPV